MYIWPKEIQQIIAEVLHAQNPITCLEKFKNYEPAKKITFLLFDGNQTTNFQYITHDYNLSKYRIVNLGNYANTAIITTSMLLDKNDLTAIKTAYSVNIDSNIVSMLPQLLKNKPITPDFLNFLVYIKKNNLDLNISPYLLEDSLNSSGMKNEARAYECLLSFFSFSDLSLQQLYSLPISPDVIAFNHADDAWSGDEGAGDGDALLLTAGQLADRLFELLVGQIDLAGNFPHLLVDCRLFQLFELQAECDVVVHRHRWEQRIALEDDADVALFNRHMGDILLVHRHRAGDRLNKAGDGAQGGRFAAARRAEEGEELPFLHVHVDIVQRLKIAEFDHNVLEFNHGRQLLTL